ncbi:sugar-binding domain-containing protein, partial [Mitsuokella jalaludinii]|uniref:sugar-binding domain-containing protein n=1 Tax=Mitsuokella jalaludinii TaxID=187979 RepID=UPI002FD8884B
PIPVMFDNTEVKRLVEQDKYVKSILDMGRRANIAVVTVGPASDESILFHLGYYINENDRELLSQKAAGDFCSRFYDDNGKIVDEELNNRTVGIQLDEFQKKETRILVAGGKEKLRAIHAALKAGYVNILITDQYTALALKEMN